MATHSTLELLSTAELCFLAAVIAHELGHVCGISHFSDLWPGMASGRTRDYWGRAWPCFDTLYDVQRQVYSYLLLRERLLAFDVLPWALPESG